MSTYEQKILKEAYVIAEKNTITKLINVVVIENTEVNRIVGVVIGGAVKYIAVFRTIEEILAAINIEIKNEIARHEELIAINLQNNTEHYARIAELAEEIEENIKNLN